MGDGFFRADDFRDRADRDLLVLYATVSESLGWATAALLEEDVDTAEQVIAADQDVDQKCRDLSGLVKDRISAGSLEQAELEDLIVILQVIPELERSADLAEHIAQRARQGLGGVMSPRARGLVQSMCNAGIGMWQLSARAYAERSRDITFELNELDDELDNLSAALLKEASAGGMDVSTSTELALVARFYERLGDHAVNLARRAAEMAAPRRLSPLRVRRREKRGGEASKEPRSSSLLSRLRRIRILPTDTDYFDMFAEAASVARQCGEVLLEMMSDLSTCDEQYQRIRALERQGDQITVEILRRLDASFVTPYDREDIHALAEELDDVSDEMFAAAASMQQVHVASSLPEVKLQAEILAAMGLELEQLIACLRTREGARHRLERIEALEREGDAIHRRCMVRLFSGDYEPLEVLKWKDIVEAMEATMNKIEDVADVVESLLVKQH
jgi:predicted phosphate transport protein (TIGR00153 family)